MSATLDLAIDLISRDSVTPEDKGCQDVMIMRLEALGFKIERMRFDDVDNYWARRGTEGPVFAFAGHTDVDTVRVRHFLRSADRAAQGGAGRRLTPASDRNFR